MSSYKYSIGIDLAWKASNYSGVCVLDQNSNILELRLLKDIKEIYEATKLYLGQGAVISVDAPVVFDNGGKSRLCEREIMRDKFKGKSIGIFCSSEEYLIQNFKQARGKLLAEYLIDKERDSIKVIETYTGATIGRMFNEKIVYKKKKSNKKDYHKKMSSFLDKISVQPLTERFQRLSHDYTVADIKEVEDLADGYLCSIISWLYVNDKPKIKRYGKKGIGEIYTLSEIYESR